MLLDQITILSKIMVVSYIRGRIWQFVTECRKITVINSGIWTQKEDGFLGFNRLRSIALALVKVLL
jgi:hypothetical protein